MKIFLVDDEYINNVISTKILNKIDSSLEIVKYTNPILAFEEIQKENPDLILLDLNMPMLSGWQFLDKMRNESLSYRVIVLTSSICKPDNVKAHTYNNVIGYVEKPLSSDKISTYITSYNNSSSDVT